MQNLVLEKEVNGGQVATQWNLSDIGTKPLAKQRLLVLLNQIGTCDPETLEMIGEEEFKAFEEREFLDRKQSSVWQKQSCEWR